MNDIEKSLRDYYKGYGVYNRKGELVEISSMSKEDFKRFQRDLARERENFLKDKNGWKVVIRKIKNIGGNYDKTRNFKLFK